jgi:repressor LexA
MLDKTQLYGLTKRQRAVLAFINRYQERRGYPPSIRDIGKGVGLSSSSTVHHHLHALEKKGFIRRDRLKPRAMEIFLDRKPEEGALQESGAMEKPVLPTKEDAEVGATVEKTRDDKKEQERGLSEYPLIFGRIPAAGFFDPENVEKTYYLPEDLFGGRDGFLLRMENDSMTGAGIQPGDLCLVRKTGELPDGEIGVAESGGAVTVKRIFRQTNAFRLEPANRKMNPVFVRDLRVLGKVTGIIRIFDDTETQEL